METVIIQTEGKKMKALKAFLQALEITFEIKREEIYDPAFIEKIKRGDDDIKNGNTKKNTLDDIWKLS
jgi:hypothetical protein